MKKKTPRGADSDDDDELGAGQVVLPSRSNRKMNPERLGEDDDSSDHPDTKDPLSPWVARQVEREEMKRRLAEEEKETKSRRRVTNPATPSKSSKSSQKEGAQHQDHDQQDSQRSEGAISLKDSMDHRLEQKLKQNESRTVQPATHVNPSNVDRESSTRIIETRESTLSQQQMDRKMRREHRKQQEHRDSARSSSSATEE